MKETGTQDYTFDIGQVAANGLQEALQKLTGVMEKFAKSNETVEKALVENTCMVSKEVDAIFRLKKTMEDHERSEQRKDAERRQKSKERRPGEGRERRIESVRKGDGSRRDGRGVKEEERRKNIAKARRISPRRNNMMRLKGKRRLRKTVDLE